MADPGFRRIGHKGADAIAPGNTLESFEAAVEAGVDMIEFDVLRNRDNRLVVAHDYGELYRRRAMPLTDALDAFREPPLDQVEFDCDLKLPGREAELAGALGGRGLLDRAMVSTMELESLGKLRVAEPELRLGWTYPKTKRDWTRYRWATAGVRGGLAALRRRLPKLVAAKAPELGVVALWAYHPLISQRLIGVADQIGIEVYAWTVDDPVRIGHLIGMGVHGICSNDPRLFDYAQVPPDEAVAEQAKPAEQPDHAAAKAAGRLKPWWRRLGFRGAMQPEEAEEPEAAEQASQPSEPKRARKAKPGSAKVKAKPRPTNPRPAKAKAKSGGNSGSSREEMAAQETQEWALPEQRE